MRLIMAFLGFACLVGMTPAHAVTLDESPAKEGDWGYRPAKGDTVALNPPAFCWRPCRKATGYVLQVGTGASFDTIAYEAETPWTAHCPPQVLPAGNYSWRYAARDTNGQSKWSTVRKFTVPEAAVPFPQPTVKDLIDRMPAEHPRLFFRAEDLGKLRELGTGPLAKRRASLVAAADKLLATPPDTTEPPKYPKGMKRGSKEWKSIWWGNRTRMSKLTDGAALLAFVYRLTGEEKYGKAARDLTMAFAEWDPKGSTNYRYNDEAAMPGLYYPSRAYTWAYPCFSEADRTKLVAVMRVRGGDCFASLRGRSHLWRPYSSHHNRAWHWLGEVAIAFHGDIPEAEQWLDYSITVLFTAYPVWNDEDGGWHEGTAYWSSYSFRFQYWADIVRSAFDIDVFQRPYFKRAGDFGLYLMPPGTQHGGFGDQTTRMNSGKVGTLMAVLASGAGNPYWKWFADTVGRDVGGGYDGYLRAGRMLDLEAKAPTDLPSSICFREVGQAVMNSNLVDGSKNVQVHFKSSPGFGTVSHGYNANNAFLLNLGGKPVFLRTGRRDMYGSPHHKDWMWHSHSDNAILVNGEGQIKHSLKAKGRILAFETSPSVDVVAGEAGRAYANLDRWTRRLIFFKPHAILIHDILEAPEPSSFQWMLHTPGAFEIAGQQAAWKGDAGAAKTQFLYPADLGITQTDQYDPPPAEWTGWTLGEWHLTAEPAAKAKRQEFLALVTINDAAVKATIAPGTVPRDVTVTLPDGEAQVTFEEHAFAVKSAGLTKRFEEE